MKKKNKGKWYCFLKGKVEISLGVVLLFALGYGSYLIYANQLTDFSDRIRFFGFTFVVVSIIHASIQFRATHDWNRRQLAITSVKEIKSEANRHVAVLDEVFNYLHRKKTSPISVEEIHKAICKLDAHGNPIREGGKLSLASSEEARNTRKAILNVLNNCEYLATGVYQGVFDQEIIEALYRGPILKIYYVFNAYIEHFNKEMYPERNNSIWEHLTAFAVELETKAESQYIPKRKTAG